MDAAKIQEWRQKAIEGTLSVEEAKEAIAYLREDRINAAAKSASSKSRGTKAAPIDGDALLNTLLT